ncbi:MAG TPA: hypothetical protein VKM72_07400 [Thermoanaerobaculia bacterium]|nr:hypothetical protein [Thermoanaerobaculia bacterium]
MSSINSHADLVTDLRELVEASDRSPEVKEEVAKERQEVVDSLTVIETLKARQLELSALRQETTQQLKFAVVRGKEAAMQFRATLKAKFGLRNERLVHFKVAPIRPRPRRKLGERKPADGEVAVPQPTPPSSKPVA